jgi:6-phospho-3-hexuloisomerase
MFFEHLEEELMTETLAQLSKGALKDLESVFAVMPDNALDGLIEAIVTAKRIVVFGLGREGLQMRGFAMRLFHMGRDVAVWGDMTTPALGAGDLFVASAGPGDLPTARTLVDIAHEAGARTALVTAQPGGGLAKHVDVVTVIPAQTMADDRGGKLSVLPMGSLFETAQMIAFELVSESPISSLGEGRKCGSPRASIATTISRDCSHNSFLSRQGRSRPG